jgi:hypothetical protein
VLADKSVEVDEVKTEPEKRVQIPLVDEPTLIVKLPSSALFKRHVRVLILFPPAR